MSSRRDQQQEIMRNTY